MLDIMGGSEYATPKYVTVDYFELKATKNQQMQEKFSALLSSA